MPSPEAINTLATAIANIFSNSLPAADPSLPQTTQDAINDAMAEARAKNQIIGEQMANAINAFIGATNVSITTDWYTLRNVITRHMTAHALLTNNLIIQAQTPHQEGDITLYLPVILPAGLSYDQANEVIQFNGTIG